MISFPQWLKTEGKEPKEEAGIKRDAMRLAIIQKLGCLCYENTSHGPLKADKHQRKGHSFSLRDHQSGHHLLLSWNRPYCLDTMEV